MKKIRNVNDLQEIQKNPNGQYKLVNDINAIETKYWNNGRGFDPIDNFEGVIEGNNHEIKNIYIDRTSSDSASIIASSHSSEIRNITVKDSTIKGHSSAAGIVGSDERGKLSNVQIKNSIIKTKGSELTPSGLCSLLSETVVEDCLVENCVLKAESLFNCWDICVGGIASIGLNTKIKNCEVEDVEVRIETKKVDDFSYIAGIVASLHNNSCLRIKECQVSNLHVNGEDSFCSIANDVNNTGRIGASIKNAEYSWNNEMEKVSQILNS